jgi:drug/metabolite transporter (DMT)-like permease
MPDLPREPGRRLVSAARPGVDGRHANRRSAVLSYALAVLAACANAASSVLQRKANKRVPQRENMRLAQIRDLLRQPVWFGGIAAITAGFLLQATALGHGELSVVEPVLVLELPFTLIIAARVFRQHLGLREWLSTAAMTAGLAGLLLLLAPTAGAPPQLHWYGWLAGVGGNLLLVGILVAVARRMAPMGDEGAGHDRASDDRARDDRPGGPDQRRNSLRAALLAVAAGSTFGLTAALIKAMTQTLSMGLGALFTHWPVYAMVAAGALGMFLTQSALNAGQLIAAQPGLTLSDPLISVLWGVMAFHETVRQGWFIPGEVACAAVIVGGVVVLARSPVLSAGDESGEDVDPAQDGDPGKDGGAGRDPAEMHVQGHPAA